MTGAVALTGKFTDTSSRGIPAKTSHMSEAVSIATPARPTSPAATGSPES